MKRFICIKMALIDEHSCECIKSELDLFSVPPTQTSIDESRYEKVYPLNTITNSGPLEFRFSTGDKDYLDLKNTFLYLKFNILNNNGNTLNAPVAAAAPGNATFVYPINYFFATQFKNVEVNLGEKVISSPDTLYAYRSYLESTLGYGNITKEQLACGLYNKDYDDLDLHEKTIADDACENKGAQARFLSTRYSKPIEVWGRIHSELFCQPKLILNKMTMTVKFHRHDPEFSLMAFTENQRYVISISEAIMHVAYTKVTDSVREAHELALLKSPAKYPLRRINMKFFTRGQGRSDLSEPNLHKGELPRRVVIGMVSSKAFNGSLHANPLHFKDYNLKYIQLKKNGTPLPFKEIELDYTNDLTSLGYLSLFHGTGRLFKDQKLDITPDMYQNGYSLYAFDLSQDGNDSNASLIETGELSLIIKLGDALPETAVIVVYLEHEGIIEIDKDRNVKDE